MLKTFILGLLLLTTSVALAPSASAACEPGTNPDYCTGVVRDTVDNTVDRAGDLLDRIPHTLPERCDWTDNGIVCYW